MIESVLSVKKIFGSWTQKIYGAPWHWRIAIYNQKIWLRAAYPGPKRSMDKPALNIKPIHTGVASSEGALYQKFFGALFRYGSRGCGRPIVKVSDHGMHVMNSSPVPLKTRRVGQRCVLNMSRTETSSRWCGVVVRRGGCELRCRPRHLTMVQNHTWSVAKSSRVAGQYVVNIHSPDMGALLGEL
ncbi:uncharacterized protein TNCV_1766191 [Trichonephila clavipes]|nr:uncharacterized protein TNCV_1766191 [Trichonephila clavipes]